MTLNLPGPPKRLVNDGVNLAAATTWRPVVGEIVEGSNNVFSMLGCDSGGLPRDGLVAGTSNTEVVLGRRERGSAFVVR